jgi:hypothetical protein
MRSFALVERESPRNNGLSPSPRRRAREGDFRDLCILASHGVAEHGMTAGYVRSIERDPLAGGSVATQCRKCKGSTPFRDTTPEYSD